METYRVHLRRETMMTPTSIWPTPPPTTHHVKLRQKTTPAIYFRLSVVTGTPLLGQCNGTTGIQGDCVTDAVCDSNYTCSKYSSFDFF